MIGIFNSFAFLFLEDVEVRSLFTRYDVLDVTDDVTLPPFNSTTFSNSLRLENLLTLPVITKLNPESLSNLFASYLLSI